MVKRFLGLTLSVALLFAAVACSKDNENNFKSDNLSDDVTVSGTEPDKMVDMSKELTYPFRNFSINLFQNGSDEKGNYMVSPLSVLTALAMTSNGADGETLEQMETTLFNGTSIEDINGVLKSYLKILDEQNDVKINIADSIWIKNDDSLSVENSFLQTNKQYYNADIFNSNFDSSTVEDINSWISLKTDGLIKNMLDKIEEDTVMYLINAICFDAKWQEIYTEYQIETADFHNYDGTVNKNVTMMNSEEYKYIEDTQATGFIKDYEGGEFGFAVLLPNEGVDIYDYVSSLTSDDFYEMVMAPQEAKVIATLPAFSSEYDTSLIDAFKTMGMKDAFDDELADFNKLGQYTNGNIYIGDVIHKTFLNVDAQGTQAGAATIVQMDAESAMESEYKTVRVDRPFVYAIIDNSTGMPLFIGMEVNIE